MSKIKLLFSLLLSLFLFSIISFADEVVVKEWTKQFGTSSYDFGSGVAIDSAGNAYVTGYTDGSLDGNLSAGNSDIFLTKYNSIGEKLWTKQWGTSSNDYGNGVAIDSAGNVYVTGKTYGSLDGNTNLGGYDIFLTKYNSSGDKQWTKQWGTNSGDEGKSVAIDKDGNVFITGDMTCSIAGEPPTANMFLTEYNSSGVKKWTRLPNGEGSCGNGVAIDSIGDAYVTGLTWSSGFGGEDIFLTKFNVVNISNGWTNQWGTEGWDIGSGVVIDSTGNAYVTGRTQGSLDGNSSVGGQDIFLTKFNSNGVKQWTNQWGTTNDDFAMSAAIDRGGNIYMTGQEYGAIFLTKYNSSGVKQWTNRWGANRVDYGNVDCGNGIATDKNGNVYVTGMTNGSLDGNTNAGSYDMFLTKFFSNTLPTLTYSGETNYTNAGVYPTLATTTMTVIYCIKYIDIDGDTPKTDYPKLHILKDSVEITSSPIVMAYTTGISGAGAIYQTSITLQSTGTYSYYFEAYDIFDATATGTPTSQAIGPVITSSYTQTQSTGTDDSGGNNGNGNNNNGNTQIQITGANGGSATINPQSGQIIVEVSANAFGGTLILSVSTTAVPSSTPNGGIELTNIAIEINAGGQQPGKPITITIYYSPSSLPSGFDENKIVIARYDVINNRYIPLPSIVDIALHKVVATTDHLSTFVLVQLTPAGQLNETFAYPIPFNPKKQTTGLTFDNLTQDAEIKIYTITGAFVKEVTYTSQNGKAVWDGKDSSGEFVASDVYIAVIKNDSEKKIIKIVVEK